MEALFLVDRTARTMDLSREERQALRRQNAQEWLDQIEAACRTVGARVLPESALGKAITYTRNQWPRFVKGGALRYCGGYVASDTHLSRDGGA